MIHTRCFPHRRLGRGILGLQFLKSDHLRAVARLRIVDVFDCNTKPLPNEEVRIEFIDHPETGRIDQGGQFSPRLISKINIGPHMTALVSRAEDLELNVQIRSPR